MALIAQRSGWGDGKSLHGRREVLLGALAAWMTACRPQVVPTPARPIRGEGAVELWSWFDLPKADSRSRELSGISWDPNEGVLWAVHDEHAIIVALRPDKDLRSWSLGETIELDIGGPVDLEGLVVVPGGFMLCSEEGPRIVEVDRKGRFRREVAVPPRFRDARTNKSLESLSGSPSGRYLFTANEAALAHDGPTATIQEGTRVRIAKLECGGDAGERDRLVSEHVYETDPMLHDGDWGVSDLAAIGDDQLFVLERGWAKGFGNAARIYRVTLEPRSSSLGVEQLGTLPPLAKTLYADLGKLAAANVPAQKQPQASPLLDNYEGLAIGPRLPDGRGTLFVVSDDNGRAEQVARLLVLASS